MKHEANWYINHKLKPPKKFFTWCFSGIHTFQWSNKSQTIVANKDLMNQGCYVVKKRLGVNTRLTFFDKYYSRTIILVTKSRIEIQMYGFSSRVENGKQTVDCQLINFERYGDEEIVKIGLWQDKYTEGLVPVFGGMSGPYTFTKIFPNDFEEKVRTISELKYLKMEEIPFWHLKHLYKYRQEIEFLQKINATGLSQEVYYGNRVDMRVINQRWLHENKNFFKNSERDFLSFELERRLKARNGKVVPGIEKYLNFRDVKNIPSGIGLVRFQNWVIKNQVNFKYYLDYLGMLKDLGVDPTGDENLIIPKDLVVAHDNAVELLNIKKEEESKKELAEQQREYAKTLKKRKKLEKEVDGFMFMLPDELDDLILEGKSLHHCVGSSRYVKDHKSGRTTIIFIRKPECLKKPFYTLEYNSGKIIQIRGKHNQNPPEEVKHAASDWLESLKRKGA